MTLAVHAPWSTCVARMYKQTGSSHVLVVRSHCGHPLQHAGTVCMRHRHDAKHFQIYLTQHIFILISTCATHTHTHTEQFFWFAHRRICALRIIYVLSQRHWNGVRTCIERKSEKSTWIFSPLIEPWSARRISIPLQIVHWTMNTDFIGVECMHET